MTMMTLGYLALHSNLGDNASIFCPSTISHRACGNLSHKRSKLSQKKTPMWLNLNFLYPWVIRISLLFFNISSLFAVLELPYANPLPFCR